ncbi:penicillin-binding protein 2 [Natronospirillum operosum]|uniref:Peptidoglycan D,D-transpeptidase MrdA n=1 Tax=Natronospirillum operosum TaxID=2759953 RepID=A0A4Z0W9E2_9GAMM|nr:penicillin-binding protein 2 [Natronospirillum operosum]TGG92753.1 penicillin-binding protein 2 [Natronospirillum operosum]
MSIERFQDYAREQVLVFRRTLFAFCLIVLLCILLGARLFYLQVMTHDVHATRSNNNRISLQALPPNRGLIYDRQGRLLAENLPNHRLSLMLERIDDLDATLAQLKELVDLSEDDIQRFHQQRQRPRRPFSPVPLKNGLSEEEIARLATDRYFLDGVEVEANLMRSYPHGEVFAHALGYVGRINSAERRSLDNRLYVGTEYVGKSGVERFYEEALLGKPGSQTVEINARGQILRVLDQTLPTPGADLQLYLDIDLQQATYEAFEGRRGAAVAIDLETGGIVSMVSSPSFDANQFVIGYNSAEYAALQSNIDLPFMNRATRGQYAPASTIKPFLGLAGLESGATTWDQRIEDPGFFQLPNDDRIFYDWTWRIRPEGRGAKIGLEQSIQESSNTFFYHLAYNTRLEGLHDMLDRFGFGRVTTADVHNPARGINPTRDWKRERHGFSWYAGDTVNLGIGQGYMLTTPLQLAVATAVMGRHGEWFTPRLLKDSSDQSLLDALPEPPEDITLANQSHWERMEQAMVGVVHGPRGTARALAQNLDYQIVGKTGTAQVFSIENFEDHDSDDVDERMRDHALFVGYAPRDNPRIAVAVIVENGASGGRVAAPIARAMFDEYLRLPPLAESGVLQ